LPDTALVVPENEAFKARWHIFSVTVGQAEAGSAESNPNGTESLQATYPAY
jgi:hypothetical protein